MGGEDHLLMFNLSVMSLWSPSFWTGLILLCPATPVQGSEVLDMALPATEAYAISETQEIHWTDE